MRNRGSIALKLVAKLMVKAGFDHIITVDMHSKGTIHTTAVYSIHFRTS
jgi:phosphoribosylpyrophosphate synthetase